MTGDRLVNNACSNSPGIVFKYWLDFSLFRGSRKLRGTKSCVKVKVTNFKNVLQLSFIILVGMLL